MGGQYGTTQRYAERFSELTRLPCIRSEEAKDFSPYDRVIHFGACTPAGSRACEGPSGPWQGVTPGWSLSPWGWRM